jgi:hypothetical protein
MCGTNLMVHDIPETRANRARAFSAIDEMMRFVEGLSRGHHFVRYRKHSRQSN